jgi:hypothetical protein
MKHLLTILILCLLMGTTACKKDSSPSDPVYPVKKTIEGNFALHHGHCSFCQAADGGFAFVAVTTARQLYIGKVTPALEVMWEKRYGSGLDNAGGIEATSDGGFIVACSVYDTANPVPGHPMLQITRLNASGNMLWQKTYRFDNSFHQSFPVRETSDHGFILAVPSHPAQDSLHYYPSFFRINGYGDSLWTTCVPAFFNETADDLRVTPDGGYVISGYRFLAKADSLGQIKWYRDDVPAFSSMLVLTGGDIAGVGNVLGDSWGAEPALARLNPQGDKVWEQVYNIYDGGNEFDVFNLCSTANGGYAFTSGQYDTTQLITTNSTGDTLSTRAIDILYPRGLLFSGGTYYLYGLNVAPGGLSTQPVLEMVK